MSFGPPGQGGRGKKKKEEGEYDYEDLLAQAFPVVEKQLSWTWEWFSEVLPMDNKEGDAMDKWIQEKIDSACVQDPMLEYVQEWKRKPEDAPQLEKGKAAPKEKVLVFADNHGLCEEILSCAPEGRIAKKKIVSDPNGELSMEDVAELMSPSWDLIIFGAALEPPNTNEVADVVAHDEIISRLYYYILKAFQKKRPGRMAILTRGAMAFETDMHNEVGLGLISGGTLFGMTNSARQELNSDGDLPMAYIDTEYVISNDHQWDLMTHLAHEIFRHQSFGHNCAVRITHRYGREVLRMMTTKPYEGAGKQWYMPEEDGAIIAISGGNGALGLVMAEWLIDTAKKQNSSGWKLELLSRSMKVTDQNSKQWDKVQKKAEKLGVEVYHKKLDMSTQEGIDEYIDGCNGMLYGFIHSAGVLADTMLMNLTWEQCQTVFDSKHRPALYLHESLEKYRQDGLRFLWMFSSIAVWGNMGQINYSGSNHYLDCLARHRKALGLPGMVVQWGGWGEVGMAATMDAVNRRRMEQSVMPSFKNSEGLQGLENLLKTNLPGGTVFKFNPQAAIGAFADDSTTMGCNIRNFYSEILPTPMPESNARKHMMTLFRIAMHMYQWQEETGWRYFWYFSHRSAFHDEYDPFDGVSDDSDDDDPKDKKDKKDKKEPKPGKYDVGLMKKPPPSDKPF